MRRQFILVILLFIVIPITVIAQAPQLFIILSHDNVIYAQPVTGGEWLNIGVRFDDFVSHLAGLDVYTLDTSPVSDLSSDGYGFHHGVWSPDKSEFAYIELSPPRYRVGVYSQSNHNIILESEIQPDLGYLDPIGWTTDGKILLLERVALNHLPTVKIFTLNPNTQVLDFHTAVLVQNLVGRTAYLPDGITVFLGFDFARNVGILLNTTNGQIRNFPTTIKETIAPIKGFDYRPVQVYGALTLDELTQFVEELDTMPPNLVTSTTGEPFLHWMLPDDKRYITCYPDSEWTGINFPTTCPGLSGRNYEGHQGTDIGDEPDGLRIGTPVYPAAIGSIVRTHRNCLRQNPSCNDSYGNTLTMEHIRVVDNEIQVWYTGYGHLQMVIANDYTYIDDLSQPIALSGATGVGGAHLHFEVRDTDNWIDPWDDRTGKNLWLEANNQPLATVDTVDHEAVPQVLNVCTSYEGNNIRSGAGTSFSLIGKTSTDTTYYVMKTEYVATGDVVGEWYQVQFANGDGWLWSGLMICP